MAATKLPEPVLRAVLLGASNLWLGFPRVIGELLRRAGGPVEVLAAFGHGRSYGAWSSLLGVRRLPGIVECGLWRQLAAGPALPTVALVTDVGNDLAYGQPADRVAGWVGTCLERLTERGAATVLMPLPLVSLERLRPLHFRVARSLLFPGHNLRLATVLAQARDLDRSLRDLARRHGAALVEPDPAWFGLDPIHLHPAARRAAWERILAPWPLPPAGTAPRPRLPLLRTLRPAELRLGRIALHTPQPARRLADGTTFAFY
jgi:hypothetical protein